MSEKKHGKKTRIEQSSLRWTKYPLHSSSQALSFLIYSMWPRRASKRTSACLKRIPSNNNNGIRVCVRVEYILNTCYLGESFPVRLWNTLDTLTLLVVRTKIYFTLFSSNSRENVRNKFKKPRRNRINKIHCIKLPMTSPLRAMLPTFTSTMHITLSNKRCFLVAVKGMLCVKYFHVQVK